MKILAIGDFHGKFPKKLKERIKKENVDLVVGIGDYSPWTLAKDFFKYCYKTDKDLWEVVGKTKYKTSKIKDEAQGKKILEQLNKLPVPVLSVFGNYDHPADDIMDMKKPRGKKYWRWNWERKHYFQKLIKTYKNIHYIDYKSFEFRGLVFIGARGHSSPGKVKSKAYKRHRKILDNLFNKNKKSNVIFVTHIVPYNTKLDKITSKNADKKVKGKHYGSKLMRRVINRWQPILNLSGHFHENPGKDKIKKTIIVNPGAAQDGKAAIIDVPEKGKIKIKFIK